MTPEQRRSLRIHAEVQVGSTYQHILWLLDRVDELEADAERYKADHLGACKTIAEMHAAAVGEVTGPNRGVVEDVADVRAELLSLRAENAKLRTAIEALYGWIAELEHDFVLPIEDYIVDPDVQVAARAALDGDR